MKPIIISAIAQGPITVLVALAWDFSDWQLWAGVGAIAWCMALCRVAGRGQ